MCSLCSRFLYIVGYDKLKSYLEFLHLCSWQTLVYSFFILLFLSLVLILVVLGYCWPHRINWKVFSSVFWKCLYRTNNIFSLNVWYYLPMKPCWACSFPFGMIFTWNSFSLIVLGISSVVMSLLFFSDLGNCIISSCFLISWSRNFKFLLIFSSSQCLVSLLFLLFLFLFHWLIVILIFSFPLLSLGLIFSVFLVYQGRSWCH